MGKAFGFGLFVLLGCFDWLLGGGRYIASARFVSKSKNKGLISTDRKTSLLSCVQYPVLYKVVYRGFNHSICPKGEQIRC